MGLAKSADFAIYASTRGSFLGMRQLKHPALHRQEICPRAETIQLKPLSLFLSNTCFQPLLRKTAPGQAHDQDADAEIKLALQSKKNSGREFPPGRCELRMIKPLSCYCTLKNFLAVPGVIR
jgi:hypothetical protein